MMRFTFILVITMFAIATFCGNLLAHGANVETVDTVVVAADKTVCELPKEIGPCRKSDLVYYHNAETKQCDEFLYGGCLGNDNRFQTQDECERTCSVKSTEAATSTVAAATAAIVAAN